MGPFISYFRSHTFRRQLRRREWWSTAKNSQSCWSIKRTIECFKMCHVRLHKQLSQRHFILYTIVIVTRVSKHVITVDAFVVQLHLACRKSFQVRPINLLVYTKFCHQFVVKWGHFLFNLHSETWHENSIENSANHPPPSMWYVCFAWRCHAWNKLQAYSTPKKEDIVLINLKTSYDRSLGESVRHVFKVIWKDYRLRCQSVYYHFK